MRRSEPHCAPNPIVPCSAEHASAVTMVSISTFGRDSGKYGSYAHALVTAVKDDPLD